MGNSCSLSLRYVLSKYMYKYMYTIVNLFFSHLGFSSGNFFLIGPFPDHCLPVPVKTIPIVIEFVNQSAADCCLSSVVS